jgi:signal transduction histidine kinase
MKLLQKTSRVYFLASALLLLVTGVLLYFFITKIIIEETREQLLSNEQRIAFQLSHNQPTTQLPPVIEIIRQKKLIREKRVITDTTLFDEIEQEEERFLQVSSIRNIKGISYRIILRQMMEEPIGYISSIGLAMGITFLFLLISTTFLNRLVFKNLWQPFYDSLAALNSFSVNQQQSINLGKTDISEFEELNTVISTLTEKTRHDYRVLKEFTENASHEIQTPLAVIQTKLDELLQTPELTEMQASQIHLASVAVQKLGKLNKSLLLLTKIENRQFSDKVEVSLPEIIYGQLQQSEDFIQAEKLTIELEIKENIQVLADPLLVEILVSNLLSNAIKHNVKNGLIKIKLSENSLIFINTGDAINFPPTQLFDRFRKANKTSYSLGLGLAIVQSICEQNNWGIQYDVQNNMHTLKVDF